MTPMNNNPLMMMTQLMRMGRNPMSLIQQMAGQDPRAAMALKMMQGKNGPQLEQLARNMAKERGVDLDSMIQQLGLK